jgi:ABC-type multidrug transport system permease subunit
MLATFRKDLRLLLRDRSVLWLSLLAPLAMITIITLARQHSTEPPRPLVPVVDDDKGPVAAAFVELLGKHANVVQTDAAGAERMVRDLNRAPAALIFPPGLSKRYLQGRPSEITLLTDPAQAIGLNTVRALLLVMDRDAAELADPLHEELLVYREEYLTGAQLSPKSVEQNIPGFTIMFVLLAVVFGSSSMMHDERNWGTLMRLRVAPGGLAPHLVGKLGVRGVVGFAQALVMLFWGWLVFGISLGSSPSGLVALSTALAFAAAALGVFVAAVAATREQTLPLSLAVTLGLAALGGLWWPISLVPEWLRVLGQLFFPTWVMYGMTDVILRDRGVEAILVPLAVTAAQGALLLAIALHLFRARHMEP